MVQCLDVQSTQALAKCQNCEADEKKSGLSCRSKPLLVPHTNQIFFLSPIKLPTRSFAIVSFDNYLLKLNMTEEIILIVFNVDEQVNREAQIKVVSMSPALLL